MDTAEAILVFLVFLGYGLSMFIIMYLLTRTAKRTFFMKGVKELAEAQLDGAGEPGRSEKDAGKS